MLQNNHAVQNNIVLISIQQVEQQIITVVSKFQRSAAISAGLLASAEIMVDRKRIRSNVTLVAGDMIQCLAGPTGKTVTHRQTETDEVEILSSVIA